MEPVVVIKAEQYNQEEITKAVEQLLHHLGAARLVRPGMRVTVKPNLLMKRQPEEATTTHPIVMKLPLPTAPAALTARRCFREYTRLPAWSRPPRKRAPC